MLQSFNMSFSEMPMFSQLLPVVTLELFSSQSPENIFHIISCIVNRVLQLWTSHCNAASLLKIVTVIVTILKIIVINKVPVIQPSIKAPTG